MNIEWAEMIVKELIKQGVRRFCIAYGNRSTPLVLAAAHHPLAKTFTHFDERGLGFFALGMAKASSEPVAVIVTSGTALGNLYPAVMEAFHSQVPLIILSADRPSDLKETAANQSCQQSNFFGSFSRFFYEFPNPQPNFSNYFIQGMIAQSVHRAKFPIRGPVHINCPFQEPFFDKEMPELFTTPHSIDYITPRYSLNIEDFSYLLEQIDLYDEGMIIIGSDLETIDLNSVIQLSKHLNFPIFTEVHSNLRIKDSESIIPYPILTLKHSKKFNCHPPKIIIQIGEKLISNEFLNLKNSKDLECIIQISTYPFKSDPDHKTNFKVISDISEFSKLACEALEKKTFSDYFQKWNFASKKISQSIDLVLDKAEKLSEPIISLLISNLMENEVNFFISNSMPIRFMNDFFHSNNQRSYVFTNRGLSGIDGNIATAIGIQKELETPLICLIGDLATLHDLNSFQLLDKNQKILFVICNNFGGQIFKKVEVSKFQNKEILDQFFIGTHKNNFDNIAKMFSIPFLKIETIDEFSFGLGQFFDQKSSMILELILDPKENETFLDSLEKEVQQIQSNNSIKSYFFD